MMYKQTVGWQPAIKREGVLTPATIGVHLKALRQVNEARLSFTQMWYKISHIYDSILYEISWIWWRPGDGWQDWLFPGGRGGCGEERMGRNCLIGQVLLWNDEMFWSQMHVVVAPYYKCTKCHWIFHVKIVNFILCKFHFNTLSFKNIWSLLEEMVDFETGVRNNQDEPGISYRTESAIYI